MEDVENSWPEDNVSDAQKSEMAFLRDREGGYVIGYGPFEERASPPESGVAFYRNDFGLRDPKPWKVPARFERGAVPVASGTGGGECVVRWSRMETEGFAEVFAEITDAMGRGEIEKTVPVVTERGTVERGEPRMMVACLRDLPETLRGYGWMGPEDSFIGATPEKLFLLDGGRLRTVALAGTARSEDQEVFKADQKEIREHEYVAGNLAAKLSDIGAVKRQRRRVIQLGSLVHFQTPIQVALDRPEEAGDLIRRLHPTPALGPLPRTEETMAQLLEWRERLGCSRWFGAPFGVSCDGVLTVVVAIRMVVWQGNEVWLPSGCGVIAESRLVNEWRELRLKRDAVKAVFHLED
jgi:menaquinone-specific isochorismate synthase